MTTRLSKWHCLTLRPPSRFSAHTNNGRPVVAPLLQHPKWQCQLTNLMVDWIRNQQDCELITAINGLTALQHLALYWYGDTHIPDLPILAQLKVVAFQSISLRLFLRSLERYATDNADLEVHLISSNTEALLSLSQPLHSRIVRFGGDYLDYTASFALSLPSLSGTLPLLKLYPCSLPFLNFISWSTCDSSLLKSTKALNCLPSSLFTLHSGVPLNRLILELKEECISAEELLLQSASELSSDHHPKTMPPLLPISDLSWIAIFQEFTPNEQMVASKMSPRCAGLVRAANLKVKSLIITDRNFKNLENLKNEINRFSLASKPAMQQLMAIPDEPSFPDYPMTTFARFSKWNCLQIGLADWFDPNVQIDTATIEQIVNIFSAVTDLKCITHYNERLVALLEHPNWQGQLTILMVNWIESYHSELITAINGLTALQCLAFYWASDIDLPDLSILAQLKVVAFRSFYSLRAFVRSLEQYATDNADLQVHLISDNTEALLSLSQPLLSRIVRFEGGYLDYTCQPVPLLCSQFCSLTSLSIVGIASTLVVPLFTALSQLHQLVHLELGVDLWTNEELPPLARPLAQLNTVRALELSLSISSHSQVQWLNLPVTMPNLQTIYIVDFYCFGCHVEIGSYFNRNWSPLNSSKTLNCLQSSLFTFHSGVPMNRLILDTNIECISAEILLLQSASEPSSDHHPKTMPPLLPISDLSWIAIFQEFTPNEQMVASKMSPRCAGLVRAANRKVKSLIITDRNVEDPCCLKNLKGQINAFSLASKPATQQLMDIPGATSFPDYPMTTIRLSKWHCLVIDSREQIDTATTEQIVNNFSAVTDLKLITHHSERLVPLLQHPKWQCQLTHFMAHTAMWIDGQQSRELIAVINGLTALQCLALEWYTFTDLPDLTILAQLKVVALQSSRLHAFVRSLERYATDNADLQVHLISGDTNALLSLSQPLHSRILRFGWGHLDYTRHRVPLLCSQFRSLTSLSIVGIAVTDVVPLFTALSQLHQLVHLGLQVDLRSREELPPPLRPPGQLNLLRALELHLTIYSHSQVQWLNLPVRMPNLKSIYIKKFYCRRCGVQIDGYIKEIWSPLNSSKALNCFQSSLFTLHSGVPMNRLILDLKGECISAEKLLLHGRTCAQSFLPALLTLRHQLQLILLLRSFPNLSLSI
ncbi:hypothetical protein TYRP_004828 [Tyrophagus putrescentiae]|nr:hypothetical protein TYRP_004828 [Tyrophagus putrescentiae]